MSDEYSLADVLERMYQNQLDLQAAMMELTLYADLVSRKDLTSVEVARKVLGGSRVNIGTGSVVHRVKQLSQLTNAKHVFYRCDSVSNDFVHDVQLSLIVWVVRRAPGLCLMAGRIYSNDCFWPITTPHQGQLWVVFSRSRQAEIDP